MKTTLLIILGFAILAVSLAQKGKKNAQEPESSTSGDSKTDSNAATKGDQTSEKQTDDSGKNKKSPKGKQSAAKGNDDADETGSKLKKGSKSTPADTSKPKKGSKSAPAEKPKKAAAAESDDEDDISIDADDTLNDGDEETDDDSDELIPSPDDLTSESDPVELAEKIRSITDKEKRKELIEELKSLRNDNKNNLPGKFYTAAYTALDPKNVEKAAAFWEKNLDRALSKAKNDMKKAVAKTKGGIGNAVGDARKLIQADPVGIALRKGEAVFLTALSDAAKNWGKIAGLGHDAVLNTSRFIRAATFPVDSIPILGDIKNNIHDLVEEHAVRGQKLTELFADDVSKSLGSAADDADRQANKKEQLLRKQFSSKRNLL